MLSTRAYGGQGLEATSRHEVIRAADLQKSFGDFEAVRGISFEVAQGECFGFLGPNGAGKTSTIRMLCCVSPLTGGSLSVLGMDVNRQARNIKGRLGVVPQEDNLDEYLSVRENLLLYGRYFGIAPDQVRSEAERLLDFVRLSEKSDVEVRSLSGGMKRRLLIARALINDPEVLVLDEPTTGLHFHDIKQLLAVLHRLRDHGNTVVVIEHNLDVIKTADWIVDLGPEGGSGGGQIIAEGTPEHVAQQEVSHTGRFLKTMLTQA